MEPLTPEQLGLYEIKYLEILHDVLEELSKDYVTVEEMKEDIVLEYGRRIASAVHVKTASELTSKANNEQIEQTESEVTDGAD